MSKNGTFFLAVVEQGQRTPAVWDPYFYRASSPEVLGGYLIATELRSAPQSKSRTTLEPIAYRSIPKGAYLSFALRSSEDKSHTSWPSVGEECLIFGTMRAYLGNVIVTPKAEWLGLASPLHFPIKSEFVVLTPTDECTYFWKAYLQSSSFLANLPMGSGGTRPRLQKDALLLTPITVPGIADRKSLHDRLRECAKREWMDYAERLHLLDSVTVLGR